jgi:hypothetical protein
MLGSLTLRLISGLLVLVMASRADADALFFGQEFAAGSPSLNPAPAV